MYIGTIATTTTSTTTTTTTNDIEKPNERLLIGGLPEKYSSPGPDTIEALRHNIIHQSNMAADAAAESLQFP